MTTTSTATRNRIRDLNDEFRIAAPARGQWVLTRGVSAEGPEFVAQAIRAVRGFDRFTQDNDPHGEHDFGSFDLAGQRLFWKIDYYDRDMGAGSENPADPNLTCRVLTLMLASEY